MLYTLGKVFFPMMIHQEKKLRARMRVLAVVCGVILVTGTVVLMCRLNKSRLKWNPTAKPLPGEVAKPAR